MTDTLVTDTVARESAPLLRGAGSGAITEALRIQSSARRRAPLARLFGANPLTPDARSWYRAALGELHVASVLAALPHGWTALAGDADHLVIGPAGAFLVRTRNHSGQRVRVGESVKVNGHRTHHIRDARFDAGVAAQELGLPVLPVLAIIDPASMSFDSRPEGVIVLSSGQLSRTLTRRPATLSESSVTMFVSAAGLDGEWVAHETSRHETRFARLRQTVNAARIRRIVWLVAGGVAAAAMVGAVLLLSV